VVVVVGGAVVAVEALEPPEPPATDEEGEVAADERDDVAWTATVVAVVAPGISLATRPPRTAAVRAAPPVAKPVIRLTFRNAAVRLSAWTRGDIDFSFAGAC
jgi:uncharacterized membrane protein YidH (DUF202 family)